MREKYDGYKSTFGNVPEPPKSGGKRQFLCLTIVCILLAGFCFGTVGASIWASRKSAAAKAAQQLADAQAEAVQRRMTVFPEPPHKVVKSKMSNYIASGFADAGCNGKYVDQFDGSYKLDATHWLALDGNNNWALASISMPGVADDYYVSSATSSDSPDAGAWSPSNSSGPVGTVTAEVADVVAPTIDSATVSSGTPNKLSMSTTEAGSPPITGTTGLTLSGLVHGAVTLSNYVITSGNITADISRALFSDETAVKLNYDSGTGDLADSAGTPNAMASFSNLAVTNSSTEVFDETAPVPDTASIDELGTTFTLNWTEDVSDPVLGSSGLFLANLAHGAATLSGVSTTGKVTTATISRSIKTSATENPTLSYTPGNFKDSHSPANNVAAFSGVAITNNSTQEYVPMPITFTITTNADKALGIPTTEDPDVTIARTQAGSDGTLTIPARVPMLNKNFTVRQAATIGALDAATVLNKAMMTNFDLSALVNPIWFFDENEETFQSHVDGEAPVKKLGLRVSKSSSDLPALKTQAGTQPATPKWYQMRGVHADTADYTFKAEFFASPNAAITLGAGNNVRYVEFPLGTVISGLGYAAQFRHTMPA